MPTDEDRWIVMVQGELDVWTRGHLPEMVEILSGLGKGVDFDLTGVTFIDSSGWEGVKAAIEALNRTGVAARVTGQSDPVRRLAALLGGPALTPAA